MTKLKKILHSIRIEEYALFFLAFIIFLFYFAFLNPPSNYVDFFENGLKSVKFGLIYFFLIPFFIFGYILYRVHLHLSSWLLNLFNKEFYKNSLKKVLIEFKTLSIDLLILARSLFPIVIFFGSASLVLGYLAVNLRGRLLDGYLMGVDQSILGFHPFLISYYEIPFIDNISSLFVNGYMHLGLVMSFGWAIFYFSKRKKIFGRYILALALVCFMSIPIWYSFPSNSPRHFNNIDNPHFLDESYPVDESDTFLINTIISENELNENVSKFQENTGIKRGDIAPISTIPSMHVAWAIIIVYYFFIFNKRTIFFILPWFFFSTYGAVYLGQHYFIDVVVSFPIAILAILITNWIIKKEDKYYQSNRYDGRENEFKERIRKDMNKLYNLIKRIPFVDKILDKGKALD